MADDLDKMLDERSAEDGTDLDALLDSRASAPEPVSPPAPSMSAEERAARLKESQQFGKPRDLPWYERAAQGFIDPLLGAGQAVQNVVPDAILNAGRKITDPIINAVAGGDVKTSDTTTAEFNREVRNREAAYQGRRAEAGQEGIDFARIGGTLANPVSWLAPLRGGTAIYQAAKAGAAAGAFQSLLQPVNSEGSFLFDKAMQGTLGAAFGGTLGGAFAGLRPLASKAVDLVKSLAGRGRDQQAAAAAQATDDILTTVGADPTRVDPLIRQTISREVQEAAELGVQPDPTTMTNRADAAALPVPIDLPRWMAGRDGFAYSWAWNKARRTGGEEFKANLEEVNRGLINNLDELGAKQSPGPFEFSKQAIAKIEADDALLSQQVDDAYRLVKDSAGRPALMNQRQFLSEARQKLKYEQVEDFLPAEVQKTLNAFELGNAPLTVEVAQTLDKVWSRAQRSATDGNAKVALGILRTALNSAPIDGQLGQESMAAYQAARALAKQRFDLIDANPAYKAVLEGKGTAEPEKFFKNFIEGANVSEIPGLKALLGPDLVKAAQNTAVDRLKKAAIGSASDSNASFGEAGYNKILQGDISGPRIRELFREAPETLGNLYRVGRVAENAFRPPQVNSVNRSQSANAGANIIEEALGSQAMRGTVGGLIQFGRDYAAQRAARQEIVDAASTGVTKEAPHRAVSARQARISDLLSRGAATTAPQDDE